MAARAVEDYNRQGKERKWPQAYEYKKRRTMSVEKQRGRSPFPWE